MPDRTGKLTRRIGATIAWAMLLHAASVRAQSATVQTDHPTARLEYRVAPNVSTCSDEASMTSAVTARLGYDPFADSPTLVRASIERHGRGLRGRIVVHREGARRDRVRQIDTRGGDCTELTRSLALAISVAIDPLVLTRSEPASSTPPATEAASNASEAREASTGAVASSSAPAMASANAASSAPPASSPPPAAPSESSLAPAQPPATRASGPAFRMGLGVDGGYGLQPGFAFGGHVVVGLRWPRASAGLELGVFAPTGIADPPGSVTVTAASALALVCAHEIPFAWLALCGVASASLAVGVGSGFPHPETAVVGPIIGVGGRIGVEIPIGRIFAIAAHGQLEWLPVDAAFRVQNAPAGTTSEPWSTAGFSADAAIDALVHFR